MKFSRRAIEILAHRGLWDRRESSNSPEALTNALRAGFGVETDVRDCLGKLVISHDNPLGQEPSFGEFLDAYMHIGSSSAIAINIKADGLADSISVALRERQIVNYFCFDMAIPDYQAYVRRGMRCFARRSEIEPETPATERAAGIWLDAFEGTWFDADQINAWLDRGQDVCVVSSELHGRSHTALWELIQKIRLSLNGSDEGHRGRLMVCTDYPGEFAEFMK